MSIRQANRHFGGGVDAVQDGRRISLAVGAHRLAGLTGIENSRGLTEAQEQARKRTLTAHRTRNPRFPSHQKGLPAPGKARTYQGGSGV